MGKVSDVATSWDAGIAQRPASETKGSINLRIEAQTRQLIDDAATALGKTRTEFMVESARASAIDVLLDRRLFVLGDADYDAFVDALGDAPDVHVLPVGGTHTVRHG